MPPAKIRPLLRSAFSRLHRRLTPAPRPLPLAPHRPDYKPPQLPTVRQHLPIRQYGLPPRHRTGTHSPTRMAPGLLPPEHTPLPPPPNPLHPPLLGRLLPPRPAPH